MNTRRKIIAALGAGALAAPFGSLAQQQGKVYRIGMLLAETESPEFARVEALRAGLRELGYIENKNIVMEFRQAEGAYDRLPELAAELIRLKPDVIVPFGIKAMVAARNATSTIPIVTPATTADLVAMGLVASLARPGGNLTGSSIFGSEIAAKQLELVKEIMPRVTHVAVLLNPRNSTSKPRLQAMETACRSLKISLRPFQIEDSKQIDHVLTAITKARIGVVVVLTDTLFIANAGKIADFAVRQRLLLAGNPPYAEAGGLIGYGPNQIDLHRRAAVFIDKILRGTKPGDIPIEQATKFEMIVNMKTAKALGIRIPQSLLVQANKVIE